MASETYYAPEPAICQDGKTRNAFVKRYRFDGSYAADTFFSVPAYVHKDGKRVRGFIMSEDGVTTFTANKYRRN